MPVIKPSAYSNEKVNFSPFKKSSTGTSAQVFVNFEGRNNLQIQLPRARVPLNASDWDNNKKFSVSISIDKADPKMLPVIEMFNKIDQFILSHVHANAGPFLKMPGKSLEGLKDLFSGSLRYSKDDKGELKPYPPTLNLKLKEDKKNAKPFEVKLYNNDEDRTLITEQTPLEVLRRGAEITPIAECTGIWFAAGKFGVGWKLIQARIDVPVESPSGSGCAILDDEDSPPAPRKATAAPAVVADEDEEDEPPAPVGGAGVPAPAVVEEDDEEEEVVQPTPPPPKATTKKVVGGKKAVAK
jgi:hypothetical protein